MAWLVLPRGFAPGGVPSWVLAAACFPRSRCPGHPATRFVFPALGPVKRAAPVRRHAKPSAFCRGARRLAAAAAAGVVLRVADGIVRVGLLVVAGEDLGGRRR